jgi:ribonucleoside-triphosphate reductase (thioredoxin)
MINKSKGAIMQNDILAKVAFSSQYAKDTETGRESWEETVNRVVKMHNKFFNNKCLSLENDIKEAFKLVKNKRIFASQRSMQFGGDPILRNNMRIYNCTFSYCDRTRFFGECFFLLLSGSGTGFSVRKKHTDQIRQLISARNWKSREEISYYIEDTIEGWSDAVWMLIESYVDTSYKRKELSFNYELLRPKGSPISSGGRSPGYKPLEIALERIRNRLRKVTETNTRKLSSLDCFDITMYLSEAVLSGGVRRSASIALFDKDDLEMMKCKHDESWFKDNSQRAYANISAAIKLDGEEKKEDVNQIIQYAKSYGEPGVTFFNSDDFGTNPCAEIGLFPVLIKDPKGKIVDDITLDMLDNQEAYQAEGYSFKSGWQACNLTEINMLKNKTEEEFYEACRLAAIIGTIQAAYTGVTYLTKTTELILKNEALIGVSLTGMCSNELSFNSEVLKNGARIVNETNKEFSKKLGIKSASRTTCIKPSGNTSTIAACSPGIHPYHSKRYIRRIRLNKKNVIWKELKNKAPEACEDCTYNLETGVVSFACNTPVSALTKDKDNAIDHLKRVKLVYESWILPGSKQSRVEKLTHSVSNTCMVKNEEWNEVSRFIWENRESLRGVALLSHMGDKVYKQAPYEKVKTGTASEALFNKLSSIDYSSLNLNISGEGENPTLNPACTSGTCDI